MSRSTNGITTSAAVTVLADTTPRWGRKVALWTAALLLAGLVGLSRLSLGAHWLTNVLGALTLGAAWLFVLLTASRTMSALHSQTAGTRPSPPGGQPTRAAPPPAPAPATPRHPPRRTRQGR